MTDYIGLEHHGIAVTHVDALCHSGIERECGTAAIRRKRLIPMGRGFGDISAFGRAWSRADTARRTSTERVPRHDGSISKR